MSKWITLTQLDGNSIWIRPDAFASMRVRRESISSNQTTRLYAPCISIACEDGTTYQEQYYEDVMETPEFIALLSEPRK
jgi:hypothetical protein